MSNAIYNTTNVIVGYKLNLLSSTVYVYEVHLKKYYKTKTKVKKYFYFDYFTKTGYLRRLKFPHFIGVLLVQLLNKSR